jgi:hypothetical protein
MKTINLYRNQIGAEGASLLANALEVNTSVTAIEIGLNGIGVEGASVLADALKLNEAVTIIALGWNQIGDNGASKSHRIRSGGVLNDALQMEMLALIRPICIRIVVNC